MLENENNHVSKVGLNPLSNQGHSIEYNNALLCINQINEVLIPLVIRVIQS